MVLFRIREQLGGIINAIGANGANAQHKCKRAQPSRAPYPIAQNHLAQIA
ncbi:MAG: hypothetical protein ACJA06_001137 [Halocynthiibacter sp.]|jgi:hypothetical protein